MITEGVQQALTVLYPLYKDEVYKRREQMMRLTAFGAFGLIAMVFALLLSPVKNRLSSPDTLLLSPRRPDLVRTFLRPDPATAISPPVG